MDKITTLILPLILVSSSALADDFASTANQIDQDATKIQAASNQVRNQFIQSMTRNVKTFQPQNAGVSAGGTQPSQQTNFTSPVTTTTTQPKNTQTQPSDSGISGFSNTNGNQDKDNGWNIQY